MTHCVAVFDAQFTEEKVAKEMEYFMRSSEKSYERTYGWAWLLKLQDGASTIHTLYTIYSDTGIHPGGFMLGTLEFF